MGDVYGSCGIPTLRLSHRMRVTRPPMDAPPPLPCSIAWRPAKRSNLREVVESVARTWQETATVFG